MSCWGFATLTTVKPPAGHSMPARRIHSVGSLDGLHRQHRPSFHSNRLTDVQPTHFLSDVPGKLNILLLAGRQTLAADLSMIHKKLRDQFGGGSHMKTVPRITMNGCGEQCIIVAILFAADEMREKSANALPIRTALQNETRLKQQHFVDFCRPSLSAQRHVCENSGCEPPYA